MDSEFLMTQVNDTCRLYSTQEIVIGSLTKYIQERPAEGYLKYKDFEILGRTAAALLTTLFLYKEVKTVTLGRYQIEVELQPDATWDRRIDWTVFRILEASAEPYPRLCTKTDVQWYSAVVANENEGEYLLNFEVPSIRDLKNMTLHQVHEIEEIEVEPNLVKIKSARVYDNLNVSYELRKVFGDLCGVIKWFEMYDLPAYENRK
jgi:hypothetical protein